MKMKIISLKFLKENGFNTLWFFLALLVIAVVVYYHQASQKQIYIENQIACRKAGQEFYKSIDQDVPYGAIYKDPEYVFSKDLNACLYRKEYSSFWADGSIATDDYSIIDIYSNKTIISLFHHYNLAGEVNNTVGNNNDYAAAVKRYFGEDL